MTANSTDARTDKTIPLDTLSSCDLHRRLDEIGGMYVEGNIEGLQREICAESGCFVEEFLVLAKTAD
jgi:hypothetical protein